MKQLCTNCLVIIIAGLVLVMSMSGCRGSGMKLQKKEKREVVIAVCGLDREEYEPDGTTLKSGYLRALRMCEVRYVLIPPGTPADKTEEILNASDGLLLIGGGDVDPRYFHQAPHKETRIVAPARDETDFLAFNCAQKRNMPILGICRGCQVINVARGGTLHQHLPDMTSLPHKAEGQDVTHEVICEVGLPIVHWQHSFQTNSAHHQAIDKVGTYLIVLARSGDGTVEACADPKMRYLLGVQWHPERIVDQPLHRQLFVDFVSACRVRNAQ